MMLLNFSYFSEQERQKYKTNDDRDIEEQARILECFNRATERAEEHDVRKQLPTYLSASI